MYIAIIYKYCMKWLLILGDIFLIILSIVLLPGTIAKYKLSKTNNFSLITIEKLPNCHHGYKNKFLHIRHEGKSYILRTKCKYLDGLYESQEILMLHKPGTNIFQFKAQNVLFDLISLVLLGVMGFFFVVIGYLKLKRN